MKLPKQELFDSKARDIDRQRQADERDQDIEIERLRHQLDGKDLASRNG